MINKLRAFLASPLEYKLRIAGVILVSVFFIYVIMVFQLKPLIDRSCLFGCN